MRRINLLRLVAVPLLPPPPAAEEPHGEEDGGQRDDEYLHLDVEVPRVRQAPVHAPLGQEVVDVQHVLPDVGAANAARDDQVRKSQLFVCLPCLPDGDLDR